MTESRSPTTVYIPSIQRTLESIFFLSLTTTTVFQTDSAWTRVNPSHQPSDEFTSLARCLLAQFGLRTYSGSPEFGSVEIVLALNRAEHRTNSAWLLQRVVHDGIQQSHHHGIDAENSVHLRAFSSSH